MYSMLGRLEKAASQDDKVSELLLANADGARLVGAVERALALRAGELFAELVAQLTSLEVEVRARGGVEEWLGRR